METLVDPLNEFASKIHERIVPLDKVAHGEQLERGSSRAGSLSCANFRRCKMPGTGWRHSNLFATKKPWFDGRLSRPERPPSAKLGRELSFRDAGDVP
jgi:hypothetical protein